MANSALAQAGVAGLDDLEVDDARVDLGTSDELGRRHGDALLGHVGPVPDPDDGVDLADGGVGGDLDVVLAEQLRDLGELLRAVAHDALDVAGVGNPLVALAVVVVSRRDELALAVAALAVGGPLVQDIHELETGEVVLGGAVEVDGAAVDGLVGVCLVGAADVAVLPVLDGDKVAGGHRQHRDGVGVARVG
jgi:hypothetical protein